MRARIAILALSLGLGTLPATAQVSPGRIAGTIAAYDGSALTIKKADGAVVTIALPEGVRIGALAERSLADIKAGDFVGSAAVEGPDGKLHAQEVHIFPEAMRGTGEGHRPMAQPKQTMTNATVGAVAEAPKGSVLQLNYAGGSQTIIVDPGTRVVALIPGDRSLLKPGAAVVVTLTKTDDGSLKARTVQAEKDGVKPLM